MRFFFQNSLPLFASVLFHAAAILLLGAAWTEPEIGKNIPAVVYPVRVRVVANTLAQTKAVPIAAQAKPTPIKPVSPMPPPAASVTEGRLEQSAKIYIESSERYFTPAELDSRPAVVKVPDLETINIGPMTEGEATLRLFINEIGTVDRIDIEHSTLPEAMVEQLQSQREQLRFTPGNKNGINVKSVISYKIELAKEPSVTTIYRSGELSR